MKESELCPSCKGTGIAPPYLPVQTCFTCGGSGYVKPENV